MHGAMWEDFKGRVAEFIPLVLQAAWNYDGSALRESMLEGRALQLYAISRDAEPIFGQVATNWPTAPDPANIWHLARANFLDAALLFGQAHFAEPPDPGHLKLCRQLLRNTARQVQQTAPSDEGAT